jgi:hypothetical protein
VPRLIVPIIVQILAPRRGTKRLSDSSARPTGGRRNRARKLAHLARNSARLAARAAALKDVAEADNEEKDKM